MNSEQRERDPVIVCPVGLAGGMDCNSFFAHGGFTLHVDRTGRTTEDFMLRSDSDDALTCNVHEIEAEVIGQYDPVFDDFGIASGMRQPRLDGQGRRLVATWMDGQPRHWSEYDQRTNLEAIEEALG